MKILIVDDDEFTLDVMNMTLQELGYKNVHTASSGLNALAVLTEVPDLEVIFCDLKMPEMDGVELIRHLARRQFTGGVILLSGEDWRILKTCEELGGAFGLDMLGSIQKPFDPNELSKLLDRLHQRHQAPNTARLEPIQPEDLKRALELGQIRAWLQPQLCTQTMSVYGVEALARWQHPTKGLIPPMAFIPVAEEHSLIDPLLKAVYRDALFQVGELKKLGYVLKVAVNLSTDNLNSHDLPEQLETWARQDGLEPGQVTIEVTESRLAKNLALSLEILTRLRLKGFGLSIDDFGTGYSSLEQLHRMPFSELKVDRGFVHGATKDSRSKAVFESSIDLARKLNITTVAEGVENEEDFQLAKSLGADYVQGYFFGRPMPYDQLVSWLDKHAVQ